jgi:hypothetical protein
MSNTTTNTATSAATPKRTWKEFGKMCCAVIWSYLTYPSRKVSALTFDTFGKVKEMCAKYIAEPIRGTVIQTIAFIKALVYGLAGTATICAALTGGLVYGGVFSSNDVKEAIVEIAPRSWLQAAYDIVIVAPYQATANADGYVRKSVGL